MAMEKLHELHQEGRYDLLVLDTPPTRNALDFIDAPKKLASFIDSRTLQMFTTPGVLGLKVIGRGSGMVFSVLKRATGLDLLEDLSAFFSSFAGMTEGFRERAELVNALLADSRSAFVLVTSPRADAVEEAGWFHHRLLEAGLPFAGVVVNRVHDPALAGRRVPDAEIEELLGEPLAHKVARNLEDYRILTNRDERNLAGLSDRLGRKPMIRVPELDEDVHDLEGLERMNAYLFR
jgi:anion-transporting  ArsA/GET3 family ATPase